MGCPRFLKPEQGVATASEDLRLPQMVTPLHYELDLELSPDRPEYRGVVRIKVQLDSPQSKIHLHSKGLTFERIEYRSGNTVNVLTAESVSAGLVRLKTAGQFPMGEGELEIRFSGQITNTPDGLYRVRDGDQDYIFSQFEPISARTAFPCFDEPRFKAPFKVSVVVPTGNLVVSNAPEMKRSETKKYTRFEFRETRPLPTYLVAFGIGPLEVVESSTTVSYTHLTLPTTPYV